MGVSDYRVIYSSTLKEDITDPDPPPPGGGDQTNLDAITWYEDFSGLPANGSIEANTQIQAADNGIVDTSRSYTGDRCMRTHIDRGDDGYGRWGASIDQPFPDMLNGGRVWFRCAMYHPTDYNPYTETGRLKWLRIGRKRRSTNENIGYIDWYISVASGKIDYIVESSWKSPHGSPDQSGWIDIDNAQVELGKWQMFEIYARLDGVEGASANGLAEARLWVDGDLKWDFDAKRTNSQGSYEGYADRILVNTYWNTSGNGGAPEYNEQWYDEMALALDGGGTGRSDMQHLATDAQGNRFIGTATKQARR